MLRVAERGAEPAEKEHQRRQEAAVPRSDEDHSRRGLERAGGRKEVLCLRNRKKTSAAKAQGVRGQQQRMRTERSAGRKHTGPWGPG